MILSMTGKQKEIHFDISLKSLGILPLSQLAMMEVTRAKGVMVQGLA